MQIKINKGSHTVESIKAAMSTLGYCKVWQGGNITRVAVFCSNEDYESANQVDEAYTDVVAIEPVEGGWRVFFDARDWEIWQGQDADDLADVAEAVACGHTTGMDTSLSARVGQLIKEVA